MISLLVRSQLPILCFGYPDKDTGFIPIPVKNTSKSSEIKEPWHVSFGNDERVVPSNGETISEFVAQSILKQHWPVA